MEEMTISLVYLSIGAGVAVLVRDVKSLRRGTDPEMVWLHHFAVMFMWPLILCALVYEFVSDVRADLQRGASRRAADRWYDKFL